MAVLKYKTGGSVVQVGGPGTPQPVPGAAVDTPNTWTADQTFTGKILSPGTGSPSLRLGDTAAANASGTNAIAIGKDAVASNTEALAIGKAATASASTATAIGGSSVASGATSLAVGRFAQATATQATALGGTTTASYAGSIAVGFNAVAIGTGSIVIGRNAASADGSGENVCIGESATTPGWRGTAVGWKANAAAVSATALGRGARALLSHDVAVGRGSWTDGLSANQVAIGFDGSGGVDFDVYFNSGHTSKYDDPIDVVTVTRGPATTPIAIHGMDGYDATAAPTNNVAGGVLKLMGGRGTGTAVGGSVKVQVAPAGGVSNNTKNAAVTVIEAGVSTTSPTLGFFAATPVVKPTGVAVTAAGIHAALVSLGLIAA